MIKRIRVLGSLTRCIIRIIIWTAAVSIAGCNIARHVPKGKYLLRSNKVTLKSPGVIRDKGEKRDAIARIIVQHPNTYILQGILPYRLIKYNGRYKKFHLRPDSLLPKSIERPVIYDSTYVAKSVQNIRSYLFNQGYFYATVKDTVIYKRNKFAYPVYAIDAGNNYLINKMIFDVDDSGVLQVLRNAQENTELKKNRTFTFSLLDQERSRITSVIRNNGYYNFSQDDIRFVLDTLDKTFLKDLDNPLENALNFISASKRIRKPTVEVYVVVRATEDSANRIKNIKNVTIYPDYEGADDRQDTTMHQEMQNNLLFKYHERYVHSNVVASRIFIRPGQLFSQADYDKTVVKLNELGLFQFIRIQFTRVGSDSLNCNIYLNRSKRLDFNTNLEVSSGTTYQLGNSAGISFRNKNFAKGANLLQISLNGGLEFTYDDNKGKDIIDHFALITEYYGVNASLDFPKFIAPINQRVFNKSSLPHTIVSVGSNIINRVQYFTLANTNASFRYNWRETNQKIWDVSPIFINVIRLPRTTAEFDERLATNAVLRSGYRENFIEGENVTFTFTNAENKNGKNYTRLKAGIEEAGALLNGVNQLNNSLTDVYKLQYAQYAKLDVDLQHFITFPHSAIALRFYAGIGVPYGGATTLPYIKQYYVGGPYSLRGWRIRSLGPGSYFDSANISNALTLDRTGDIRLEWNGEYRFPVAPLFAGLVKMNGALFADAGNIWLSQKDTAIAGGEFAFEKLGRDIAMDVGIGSRFEIASFLTFRLDVAFPIKKPYVPEKGGWVVNKVDFGNGTWRANNVVINISIGYPF